MTRSVLLALILMGTACKKLPEADPELSDALRQIMRDFDLPDEEVAPLLRAIERQTYLTMDVVSRDEVVRSAAPDPLELEDVQHYEERPDEDPATATAVAVSGVSPHDIDAHAIIPLMKDQTIVEPQSPEHYERRWLAGEDCWGDRECLWLQTDQDLTKKGILTIPAVTYAFFKDFRWINIGEGREERWAYYARSWNPDRFESGNYALVQSYTVEFWFPRDGGGFLWADHELEPEQEVFEGDSAGGGTLRLLTLWTETSLDVAEATERGTIRWGINQNFKAHDDWLDEQAD